MTRKSTAESTSPLDEVRSFVHALNTDMAHALQREEKSRKDAEPYVDMSGLFPNMLITLYAGGVSLLLLTTVFAAIYPSVVYVGFGAMLAFFAGWGLVYYRLSAKRGCKQLATRAWDMTLADAGRCEELEGLIQSNPQLSLMEAVNRTLYVADLELAHLLVERHRQTSASQEKAQREQAACARLHSAVAPI